MTAWVDDIRHYWFDQVGPDHWFRGGADLDEEVRARFAPLWHSLRHEPAVMFATDAGHALAATILFDQFPRNMFRHQADAFATDALALAIAGLAVDSGFDAALARDERIFLYMPFMHAEDPDVQDRSVALFDALGLPEQQRYAILHRDVIRRFGRFPHRNEILGRESRPEETDAIATGGMW